MNAANKEQSRSAERAVVAPSLEAAARGTTVPETVPADLPAEQRGTKPAARRHVVFRYCRAAARAVPRGKLSTITAARQVQRLGVRPTDTLFVYRIRRLVQFLNSPVGVVLLATVFAAMVWTLAQHPGWVGPAGWTGLVIVTGLAGWAGWGMADGLILWPHRSMWVNEMGYALRPILDLAPDIPAAKFVHWDRDFGDEDTQMRITLPRGFVGSDDDRKALLFAVREVGGFQPDDLNHKFLLAGRSSFLQLTPREKLLIPQIVRATDDEFRAMLEEVRSGRPLLALGRGSMHILGDLDGDAPHVGISMRTGKGKSNTIKGFVAQEMHLGASVVILDYKRRSLKCFKGLEGVMYCRDIAEIHSALIWLANEAMHRNVLADELGDDEEPPWQRRLCVMEEQNSTIKKLRRYWLQVREPGDPAVSPAVDAYEELLNMGRQVNVHVLACFQKLTAAAAGGTENRDQYGMVVVSAPKSSVWKMLADDIPMPDIAGKPVGRTWYLCDGEAHEGQAFLWTDKAAREWASSGVSSEVRAHTTRGSQNPAYQEERPARRAGIPIDAESQERLYTIREASSDKGHGIVSATHQTLRGQRVTNPREFPSPDDLDGQKKLYRAETLRRWENNREKAPA